MARWRTKIKESIEAVPMQWSAQITLPNGQNVSVQAGDYLITREDGTQEFMPKVEFLERYEEVKTYGRGRKPGTKNKPKDDLGMDMEETEEDTDGDEETEEEDEDQNFRPHPKPSKNRRPVPPVLR